MVCFEGWFAYFFTLRASHLSSPVNTSSSPPPAQLHPKMAEVLITVPARGKMEHTVEISAPGLLRWRLSTVDTVGLSLEWRSSQQSQDPATVIQVQPLLRLGPLESHYYTATTPGEFKFTLDNTSSFISSKVVTLLLSKEPLPTPLPGKPTTGHLRVGEDDAKLNLLGTYGARLFFCNQFEEAEAFFGSERLRVPVFAISYATIAWLRALMTMDKENINEAQRRLAQAQALCEAYLAGDSGALLGSIKSQASSFLTSNMGRLGSGAMSLLGMGSGSSSSSASATAGSAPPLSPSPSSSTTTAYTPLQLEATLIYGEATLLTALLNLMDESFLSLLKCGLNIRAGWAMYKSVDRVMGGKVMGIRGDTSLPLTLGVRCTEVDVEGAVAAAAAAVSAATSSTSPAPPTSEMNPLDVEGGLQFGAGGFNCVASLLPPVVLRILSAVGFPNDRGAGLAQLRACFLGGRIRSALGGILLSAMGVVIPSFHTGAHDTPLGRESSAALEALLVALPNSALPLWLAGRSARMRGLHAEALALFHRCGIAAGSYMQQLEHLCAYESAWCHACNLEWESVLAIAIRLERENNWSKSFYAYMRGVALLELGRVGEARQAMVSVLTQSTRRLGGKVIPAEQYALRRAGEFVAMTVGAAAEEGGEEGATHGDSGLLLTPPFPLHRVRLPAHPVPRGSPAHAALLSYPLAAPGLELLYYFGCFSQMGVGAVAASLGQCDALLGEGGIGGGEVFKVRSGEEGWGKEGGGGFAFTTTGTPSSSSSSSSSSEGDEGDGVDALLPAQDPDRVTAMLVKAVGVLGFDHKAILAAAAAVPSSSGATKSVGGGFFMSILSTISSTTSKISGGVVGVGGLGGGGGGGGGGGCANAVLEKYATPNPTTPAHATAVIALLRGALSGVLGRMDEAEASLAFVCGEGPSGQGSTTSTSATSILPREYHTYAYAFYERGLLALDALGVLGTSSSPSLAGQCSTRELCTKGVQGRARVMASGLFKGVFGGDVKGAGGVALGHLKRAKGVRQDFPWRVRLHIRVHLGVEEERGVRKGGVGYVVHKGKGEFAGEGGEGGGGGEEGEEEEEEEEEEGGEGEDIMVQLKKEQGGEATG